MPGRPGATSNGASLTGEPIRTANSTEQFDPPQNTDLPNAADPFRRPHHSGSSSGGPGAVWDERFAANEWPSHPDDTLVELVSGLAPGRAVDLGCGPGRNSIWLASQGWQVTGVDASAVGLEQAAQRGRELGVTLELLQADLTAYTPPAAAFDLVVLANMHFSPGEREELFSRFASAVAPGGHFYVVGHHLDSLGRAGPPDPARLYSEDLLQGLFAGFDVEVTRRERAAGYGGTPLVDAVAWATRRPSGGPAQGIGL
jgi:SAM-dependent methyltransferase